MRRWVLASTVMILLLGGGRAALAQEGSEGAQLFVRMVYGSYQDDHPSPIDETQLGAVWSPRMAGLIRRSRELANGEPSYLHADPICNCQDFENLTVEHIQIFQDPQRPDVVRMARVAFINAGQPVTVLLVLSGSPIQGWRIDDVVNQEGLPSLAEALVAWIAGMEAGGTALRQ
ncbi:DUF3828 domain-containing protein [Brevundimonas sp.]|uniref:DUF3828 domain-containing protein n=1 Tax=Brevundimonas sp. TaxID=1871086 RepID=UPI003BA8C254